MAISTDKNLIYIHLIHVLHNPNELSTEMMQSTFLVLSTQAADESDLITKIKTIKLNKGSH